MFRLWKILETNTARDGAVEKAGVVHEGTRCCSYLRGGGPGVVAAVRVAAAIAETRALRLKNRKNIE